MDVDRERIVIICACYIPIILMYVILFVLQLIYVIYNSCNNCLGIYFYLCVFVMHS